MFGKRLKQLRELKGISQTELGNHVNVSYRVIGYYENEQRFPNDENVIRRIADYFDVTIDYLLGYTDDKNIYRSVKDIPLEVRELGASYITVAKELKDEDITVDEIKDMVKLIKKYKK